MHLQVALCFDRHQALVSLLQPLHAALVAFLCPLVRTAHPHTRFSTHHNNLF